MKRAWFRDEEVEGMAWKREDFLIASSWLVHTAFAIDRLELVGVCTEW